MHSEFPKSNMSLCVEPWGFCVVSQWKPAVAVARWLPWWSFLCCTKRPRVRFLVRARASVAGSILGQDAQGGDRSVFVSSMNILG